MADEDARSKPGSSPARGAVGNGEHESTSPTANASLAQDEETKPSEVEQLKAELAACKDRWLRDRADLENFKKRMAREKAETLRFASEGLLRDLLPVLDNLQRAVDHSRASRDVEPVLAGVEMVLRSFTDVLARHGVKVVEARGQRFDPSQHEAIGHVEDDQPPNTVVDEHQRGYLLHDRLLRPALVTVGKGSGREAGTGDGAADVEKTEDDD